AIEHAAVQLRYGVFDEIDYRYLPQALAFHIREIKHGDDWLEIGRFIPGYEEMLEERSREWLVKGLASSAFKLGLEKLGVAEPPRRSIRYLRQALYLRRLKKIGRA
ncbi:MAG: hypothetical protein ACLGHL_08685, partial [Actinomycetota bacterium]